MKINPCLRPSSLNWRKRSAGFTLTELLLAASLTIVVIGGVGLGLGTMTNTKKSASAKVERRTDTNRATEFISNEIRRAVNIEADTANIAQHFNDISPSIPADKNQSAEAVLVLDIPGLTDEVIYYVANSTSAWIGPKVLYRYGPSIDVNGNYTGTWSAEPLIDRVYTASKSSVSCESDEVLSSSAGFTTCIGLTGEKARLYLNAEIEKNGGEQYQAYTQAFARADDAPSLGSTPSPLISAALPSSSSSTFQATTSNSTSPFSVSNGSLTINTAANLTFEVLGGDIQCGATNPKLDVTTQFTINGQTLGQTYQAGDSFTLPSGSATTVEVTGTATGTRRNNGCNYSFTATSTNTNQVYALVNGDPVPDIAPMYNQNTIESFLQQYIENGKIKIADNQVIYLFELGTTSKTSKAYDLQDNVVLVTIDTSSSSSASSSNSNGNGCNNGVGDGSDGCTPGNAPANDECATAAPGSPCNQGGNGNGSNSSNANNNANASASNGNN